MFKYVFLVFSVFLSFVISCGYQSDMKKDVADDGEPIPSTTKDQALTDSSLNEVEVTGYVSSISITVDGVQYDDGEVFYTSELNRLEKIVEKEYPGYTFSLEADVGVRDMKWGLAVFLVSENDGFADESRVDNRGKFSFYVPITAVNDTYMIRAYKRIGLRLTPPNEDEKEIYWCYNMYAERTKNLKEPSMILRDFMTRITRYQCGSNESGLQIPSKESTVQNEIDNDPSLTPEEIADIRNSLDTPTTETAMDEETETETETEKATGSQPDIITE